MRKFLLSLSVVAAAITAKAQTIADFESPKLPKADTAYINYSLPGKDVGFESGLAHFPCVYDTVYGGVWSSGFAYSNRTDSVTGDYTNGYSAKTAKGFAGSDQYAVAFGIENTVILTGAAAGKTVAGFYATNSTYAYNTIRDGNTFSRKFTGAAKDFFRLDVFAYSKGILNKDSVSFYLADFRNTDTTKNYIVRDWQWVNLLKLGNADSLLFRLTSSDVGSFGMNTPGYFCMDNFITNESGLSSPSYAAKADLKVYPNPANNVIFVESNVNAVQQVTVSDLTGRTMAQYELNNQKLEINIASLSSGTYMLTFRNGNQLSSTKFVKQ